MPIVRRVQSPSVDNCIRSHPYSSSSKNVELHKPTNLLGSVEDLKEWEEARCPICIEHPHNAVLLKCSSHEKGCRPYMCNTSYRHSNCLDQFCKSFASHLSSAILQEIPLTSTTSRRSGEEASSEPVSPSQCGSQLQPKITCPLCRGEIYGYMVLKPARRYMNSKPRGCSSETCEFQGTYSELRKHARSEHPSVRPSEVDPSRQRDWIRMEHETDFEDLYSSIHTSSHMNNGSTDTDSIMAEDITHLMSLFMCEMLSSIEHFYERSMLTNPVHDRRRFGTVQRASPDTETMHQMNRTNRSIWRTSLSPSHDNQLETIRTARWRTNLSSSTRMDETFQQIPETSPEGSSTSSGRVNRHHQLRWRDQRWLRSNTHP